MADGVVAGPRAVLSVAGSMAPRLRALCRGRETEVRLAHGGLLRDIVPCFSGAYWSHQYVVQIAALNTMERGHPHKRDMRIGLVVTGGADMVDVESVVRYVSDARDGDISGVAQTWATKVAGCQEIEVCVRQPEREHKAKVIYAIPNEALGPMLCREWKGWSQKGLFGLPLFARDNKRGREEAVNAMREVPGSSTVVM